MGSFQAKTALSLLAPTHPSLPSRIKGAPYPLLPLHIVELAASLLHVLCTRYSFGLASTAVIPFPPISSSQARCLPGPGAAFALPRNRLKIAVAGSTKRSAGLWRIRNSLELILHGVWTICCHDRSFNHHRHHPQQAGATFRGGLRAIRCRIWIRRLRASGCSRGALLSRPPFSLRMARYRCGELTGRKTAGHACPRPIAQQCRDVPA